MGHAIGIKDQKISYKNGISEEKTYFVTTLGINRFRFSPSNASSVPGNFCDD